MRLAAIDACMYMRCARILSLLKLSEPDADGTIPYQCHLLHVPVLAAVCFANPGSSLLTDLCPYADPDAHCAEEYQNVLSVLDCAAEPELLLLAHQHCGGCWVRRRHHPRHPRLRALPDCCLRRRIPDSSRVCLRNILRLTLEHQRPCKQQLEGQVPFASSSQTS